MAGTHSQCINGRIRKLDIIIIHTWWMEITHPFQMKRIPGLFPHTNR